MSKTCIIFHWQKTWRVLDAQSEKLVFTSPIKKEAMNFARSAYTDAILEGNTLFKRLIRF